VKTLTREQLQKRKEKAVRFVRDVLDDPDRAAEIDDEDLEDYAARKKLQIINPNRSKNSMATTRELQKRIRKLEEENQELSDQLDAISDIVSPDEEDEDETDDADGNGRD
jgi:hypothetical protein